MKKISVRLEHNSYNIRIGPGLLNQTSQELNKLGFSGKAVIITNPLVRKLYGNHLKQNLDSDGFTTTILEVPDGEEYKSLESAGKLYSQMIESSADRKTPVLALGGGVIGDLAGFVAATYMRGVPVVQLPTTLLSQVDSSIGGKTAVNHGKFKNEIGAFHQPEIVISDISALKTLPEAQIANGLAEIIKSAVIQSKELFVYLEKNLDLIKALDDNVLETIVSKSARIKARLVEKDERDTGPRNILNFGHTVGHAVETVSNFQVSHGQSVAIGMVAAAKIAFELGVFDIKSVNRLQILIKKAGLMTKLPELEIEQIIQVMRYDKKALGGKVKFILPRSIGQVFITNDVSHDIVENVLREMR